MTTDTQKTTNGEPMTDHQRRHVAFAINLVGAALMFAAVAVLVLGTLGDPTVWRQLGFVGLTLAMLVLGGHMFVIGGRVCGDPETEAVGR